MEFTQIAKAVLDSIKIVLVPIKKKKDRKSHQGSCRDGGSLIRGAQYNYRNKWAAINNQFIHNPASSIILEAAATSSISEEMKGTFYLDMLSKNTYPRTRWCTGEATDILETDPLGNHKIST